MKAPKNPLLRLGEFLADKWGMASPEGKNKGLVGDLTALAGRKRQAGRAYYAKKIADCLLLGAVMGLLCVVVYFTVDRGSRLVENNQLQRPGYGMGDRKEELEVQLEGETQPFEMTVTVQGRRYTSRQAEELLEKSRDTLEELLSGENESLDAVRSGLNFPSSLENGAVTVEWMTMPYGMIDENGQITGQPDEQGSVVEIQAVLTCQEQELIYETAVCVYPPVLSEQERLWQAVESEVKRADEEGARDEVLDLPGQVEGRKATWLRQREALVPLFLALTVILPLCLWLQRDQKVRQKAGERRLQMALDYPELMWKMTMLLGAGLTIRGTFLKITAEYRKNRTGQIRYAYEEMLFACGEMKSGVPESTAYENFGRRCGLPQYIKLGSLLSQNLKKGSKGLASILEKEAASSMEERQNMARKLGEQAGTKLLFPMAMMFGVVLTVLIVPAFLSM